jgi:hypothetical protein
MLAAVTGCAKRRHEQIPRAGASAADRQELVDDVALRDALPPSIGSG